jgi:hypothetical protein
MLLGASVLAVVLLTAIVALTGTHPSSDATAAGGRITLDIPGGIAADESGPTPPPTAAPSRGATTAPPATAAEAHPSTTTSEATAPAAPPPSSTSSTSSTVGRPTGGIYGQVVSRDGTPLPGLCLAASHQIDPQVARTGPDGMFALPEIAAGPTTVRLVESAPGCAPLSGSTVAPVPVEVLAERWIPVLVTVTLPGQ